MCDKGMVHVYYGDGQGKTCAAVGLAIRACGGGNKVLFMQFIKNGLSGELTALKRITENVEVMECKPCDKLLFDMNEHERAQVALEQHDAFLRLIGKIKTASYDLLVLDEVLEAVKLGMISVNELLEFLGEKPEHLEVVLTGHEIFQELLERADYVSEIIKVKHPYDKGTEARKGVEF